jgi:hypothetical protein
MLFGPLVFIYGLSCIPDTCRVNDLFVFFVFWFTAFDLYMRTSLHESRPLLFAALKSTGALLALSAAWGIYMGVILGSQQIVILFAGVLLYGLGGFLSTWLLAREMLPRPRKCPAAA